MSLVKIKRKKKWRRTNLSCKKKISKRMLREESVRIRILELESLGLSSFMSTDLV